MTAPPAATSATRTVPRPTVQPTPRPKASSTGRLNTATPTHSSTKARTTPARPTSTRTAKPVPAGYSLNVNQDGTTTRWDPCRPITYRINLATAPSGAKADIKTALAKVAAATGLRFTYAGTTTTVPNTITLANPGTPDLTFAWLKPGTSDLLDNATESARGGWQSAPTLDPATGLISWRIVRGYVLLDTTDAHTWEAGFGRGRRRGTLLMHEIGHAVGLNHNATPGQVMNGQITSQSTGTWGKGDKAGLRAVGVTGGCLP